MAKRKYKSKLDKLLENACDDSYITTPEDCHKWFKILNREIFYNTLVTPSEIDIRWRRGAYAYYDTGTCRLLMNKRYKSKKFFVEVLAHEMVHHYQYTNNEEVGHGSSFLKWRDKFNKKGLNLVRAY